MEATGVTLDTVALKQSSGELTASMNKLEQEVYELAGAEFNINSTKQVGEILFDRLKLDEKAKKTKTGGYSTSEDVLEKLRNKHPIIGKLLEYRGLKKLLSTYIDALPELINPQGRKDTYLFLNQAVTSTGRLSFLPIRTCKTFPYGTNIWVVRSVRHLSRTIRIASSSGRLLPGSNFVSWPT